MIVPFVVHSKNRYTAKNCKNMKKINNLPQTIEKIKTVKTIMKLKSPSLFFFSRI